MYKHAVSQSRDISTPRRSVNEQGSQQKWFHHKYNSILSKLIGGNYDLFKPKINIF